MKIQTRDATITAPVVTDRRVRFIASTPTVDSYGTSIKPRGCNLKRFKAAGSVPLLWAHKRDGEPDDVLGRVVSVEITDAAVICVAEFEAHPKATQVLDMIRRGVIRGCSIGFTADDDAHPNEQGDINSWSLVELSVTATPSNFECLAFLTRSFRDSVRALPSEQREPIAKRASMNFSEIVKLLGVSEAATGDEIAQALIKFLGSEAADADKNAVVVGLLAKPASASSASDGAAEAAAEALGDEVRKLQGRIAELEEGKAKAETEAKPTPEQRADKAIAEGRWAVGQRDALVAQFKAGREPFLLKAGTFSSRTMGRVTEAGQPKAKPVFQTSGNSAAKSIFDRVDSQLSGRVAD
jgi:HK97 family phage prohead protease